MLELAPMEPLPSGLKSVLTEPSGLKVEIFYLECLAQASYIISHQGKAFLVDPRRDVEAYLEVLRSAGHTLCGVLETHFHADFVSGHCEVGRRVGVPVYFGPSAKERCKFPVHELQDNEVIEFSSQYSIQAVSTPGHTMESVVYLVLDKTQENKPIKAFTGDTLFIGSCGRPDLVGSIGFTAEHMSRLMFNTLRNKIATLPDDVQVFPAHGAGSPCGKNISKDLYSTIAKEKASNPALSYTNEDNFVKFLTANQPDSPKYFHHNVQLNTEGAQVMSECLASVPKLPVSDFMEKCKDERLTLMDTRKAVDYCEKHIPGALNFPLGDAGGTILGAEDGNFGIWVGTCLPSDVEILLVNPPGKDSEALQRLARIGYTNVKGVLSGGMAVYLEAGLPTESRSRVDLLSGDKSLSDHVAEGVQLLDVRTEGEFQYNTVQGAINIPLAKLDSLTHLLTKENRYLAFCLGGFRSTIAASMLTSLGFKVHDVDKGFAAISVSATQMTTTGKVCPNMKKLLECMTSTHSCNGK